jgi:hypothetical protein
MTVPAHLKRPRAAGARAAPGQWGGWRGSPNSIAALHQHRPVMRRCRRCSRMACHGQQVCRRHHGTPLTPPSPERLQARAVGRLQWAGLLPPQVTGLACWGGLYGLTWAQAGPIRLGLILAWDARDRDPSAWVRALRLAEVAADQARRRVAKWRTL